MTYENNLDPDEAPQNVGLHLRSKLFDIQIIYQQKKRVETMTFLKNLKETNIWKNYPACKELNNMWRKGLRIIRNPQELLSDERDYGLKANDVVPLQFPIPKQYTGAKCLK